MDHPSFRDWDDLERRAARVGLRGKVLEARKKAMQMREERERLPEGTAVARFMAGSDVRRGEICVSHDASSSARRLIPVYGPPRVVTTVEPWVEACGKMECVAHSEMTLSRDRVTCQITMIAGIVAGVVNMCNRVVGEVKRRDTLVWDVEDDKIVIRSLDAMPRDKIPKDDALFEAWLRRRVVGVATEDVPEGHDGVVPQMAVLPF